jgi:hypothetical protein
MSSLHEITSGLVKQVSNKSEFNRNPRGIGGWKPGQSGNPKGRPKKGSTWAEILRDVAERIVPNSDEKTFKEVVAVRLFSEAVEGNVSAMKVIFNRMDGPPKIPLENPSESAEDAEAIAQLLQEMYKRMHAEV